MDGCKGLPRDGNGYAKPCPERNDCARFKLHIDSDKPNGYSEFFGPYDFDDEECGKFIPST